MGQIKFLSFRNLSYAKKKIRWVVNPLSFRTLMVSFQLEKRQKREEDPWSFHMSVQFVQTGKKGFTTSFFPPITHEALLTAKGKFVIIKNSGHLFLS